MTDLLAYSLLAYLGYMIYAHLVEENERDKDDDDEW